jgi:hypothetical protein
MRNLIILSFTLVALFCQTRVIQAQPDEDSAFIEYQYQTEYWAPNYDPVFVFDIMVRANTDIKASQLAFCPDKKIILIDSVWFGPEINAEIPLITIVNDSVFGPDDIRTFFVLGAMAGIEPPYDNPLFPASDEYILFAQCALSINPSCHDSLISQWMYLYFDSCFFPPVGDFILSNAAGGSIIPALSNDPIQIIYWPAYICGDANGDNRIDIEDVYEIINYVFYGSYPYGLWVCDTNCENRVNISDVVWLINYLYLDGPAPGDCF